MRWLEAAKRADKDRFFLWVHYQDPHGPYQPPVDVLRRFERPMPQEPRPPIGQTIKGKGQIPSYQVLGELGGGWDPEHYRVRYDAEIAWFDEHFGHLVEALRRLDWYEDALIVFTAITAVAGRARLLVLPWRESLRRGGARAARRPLPAERVARARRDSADRGERVKDLVSHLDLWPTILESIGLPRRENRGTSLFRGALPHPIE